MPMDEDAKNNTIISLLSDIQSKLAVNINDTKHLEDSMNEIKQNIQADRTAYALKREMDERFMAMRNEIPSQVEIDAVKGNFKLLQGIGIVINIIIVPIVLYLFFKFVI